MEQWIGEVTSAIGVDVEPTWSNGYKDILLGNRNIDGHVGISCTPHAMTDKRLSVEVVLSKSDDRTGGRRTTRRLHIMAEEKQRQPKMLLAVIIDDDDEHGYCPDEVQQQQWLLNTLRRHVTEFIRG